MECLRILKSNYLGCEDENEHGGDGELSAQEPDDEQDVVIWVLLQQQPARSEKSFVCERRNDKVSGKLSEDFLLFEAACLRLQSMSSPGDDNEDFPQSLVPQRVADLFRLVVQVGSLSRSVAQVGAPPQQQQLH